VAREYVIVDESGDPGAEGDPIYILVAVHADEDALHDLRAHLTAFRYHDGPRKEFKNSKWAAAPVKEGNGLDRLLQPIAAMADEERITITAVWLNKTVYASNGGPYLTGASGDTIKFRNFQLRRLLQTHVQTRKWGDEADLVIDRWRMTDAQRTNLEEYLRNNFALRPVPWISLVDSVYCDVIQIADVVTRVVRRCVTGATEPIEQALCDRLVHPVQLKGGLYA
jgi:hypothetical protein